MKKKRIVPIPEVRTEHKTMEINGKTHYARYEYGKCGELTVWDLGPVDPPKGENGKPYFTIPVDPWGGTWK